MNPHLVLDFHGCFPAAPERHRFTRPTTDSIARIEAELAIHLPEDFRELAATCDNYDVYFTSIGPDYESTSHILNINRFAHDPAEPNHLPESLVSITYGYDGDYDCLDRRTRGASGEHPLFYCGVSEWSQPTPNEVRPLYSTFADYLSYLVTCFKTLADKRCVKSHSPIA